MKRYAVNFSDTIRQVGHVSVVEVTGKLTSFERGALRTSSAKLLKEGRKQILLNLSGLAYLDSSGIGDLVHTYMSVIKSGGAMKVVGLTDKVEEILKITQLYQEFQELHDERPPLQRFPATPTKPKPAPLLYPPHKN